MSTETALLTTQVIELIEQVKSFCESEQIISVTISNEMEHNGAAELGKKLAAYGRDLEATRKELKEPHLQKGREIDKTFNPVKEIVDNRVKSLGNAIRGYLKALEDKRAEEQRKADEAARRERERIEAQAREQREKEEAARKAAEEAARKAAEATSEKNRKAFEAEARRKEVMAIAAASKAAIQEEIASRVVAPVMHASESPKPQGVSSRKNWRAEVKDSVALIQWCVKTENWQFIEPNLVNLNKQAKMTENTKEIPGVRFFNDESTILRK